MIVQGACISIAYLGRVCSVQVAVPVCWCARAAVFVHCAGGVHWLASGAVRSCWIVSSSCSSVQAGEMLSPCLPGSSGARDEPAVAHREVDSNATCTASCRGQYRAMDSHAPIMGPLGRA